MKEDDPDLTIRDMLKEALKNVETNLRTNIIPEESDRFFKEYNDDVSKEDYNTVLNEYLDFSLKYQIEIQVKAGTLQRRLSKKLNIPLGQLQK